MPTRIADLRQRMFRSLAQPNYRRYFLGHAVSVIGTWMQRVGQDWLVLELSHSGLALGIVLVCQFLPVLLGGMWGGVVVDRVDIRRLIIATQAVQAVLAGGLAALTILDVITLPVIFVFATLLGVVTVFDTPARQVFVTELVEDEDAVNAQSLNSLVHNVGRLAGPAVAGALIATLGVGITFAVNALSFVAVLVGLFLVDVTALRGQRRATKEKGQALEGLRYVWRHPELRASVLLMIVLSVFGQNFRVVFPLLASVTFQGGAQAYGWLTAMLGLGAVLGALGSAASSRPTSWGLLIACCAFGAVNFVVAGAPGYAVALVAVIALGSSNVVFNAIARTLLQIHSEQSMRGRVMAVYSLVFLGSIPIGGVLVGLWCELFGPRAGMALAGGTALLAAAVAFPRFRAMRSAAAASVHSGVDCRTNATVTDDDTGAPAR